MKTKSILYISMLLIMLQGMRENIFAQGMHFSQYYNAPMLLNPANTALMPDHDYRLGANYRNQWANIPVNYSTFSAYGDLQVFRNTFETSWLGLGAALFNDRVGDGNLSLTRGEAFAAYHIIIGYSSMLSVGLSGAAVQRSVDYGKLVFDRQWNGISFDNFALNGENGVAKSSFMDVGAGINYAFFPNDAVYIKAGIGLAHINRPKETFYNYENKLGMRPTANIDAMFFLNDVCIINPSVYYTRQQGSQQLLYGSLFNIQLGRTEKGVNQLIMGAFHRWDEAIVGAVGYDWGKLRVMASYDHSISGIAAANNGRGAMEISLRYQDIYTQFSRSRKTYGCPRF